jgi:hypothetical protein
VFAAFDSRSIVLRRGQFGLIAAAPGCGKSALALTLALRCGVSFLYISADSDAFTQVARSVAALSGIDMGEAELFALGKPVSEKTSEAGHSLDGLPGRFTYFASPTLEDLERTIQAFEELYGEYPALIVIDNITNVRSGLMDNDSDPFSGLEGFLDYAHSMARDTQACVLGLHHVTGPYNDADKPVPLSGVKGQIGRVPELILTLHRLPGLNGMPDLLRVSAVKNRGSKADTSGAWFAELEFDGSRMQIRDPGSGSADDSRKGL